MGYYVSSSGNNANPGTEASPVQSINYAISQSPVNSDIYVKREDKFFESVNINKSGLRFFAYGTGNLPVITGLVTLTGWTSIGNGLYEKAHSSLQSTVRVMKINGAEIGKGRWPKANATNGGYLNISSAAPGTVSNSAISTAPNFVGGSEVVIRSLNYVFDRMPVTGKSGSTITYSGSVTGNGPYNGYGFFLQNHVSFLTELGDWMYNPATKKITMFFGAQNPSNYTIECSEKERLLTLSNGATNATFNNLHFTGSNDHAVYLSGGSGFKFRGVEISYAGLDAINFVSHPDLDVDSNCWIHHANNNGILGGNGTEGAKIQNSIIEYIALNVGNRQNGIGNGQGVQIPRANSLLYNCDVRFIGYIAVRFEKKDTKVIRNRISYFCLNTGDGGGIYNWNGGGAQDKQTGLEVTDNIVHHSGPSNVGTPYAQAFQDDVIYIDDHGSGVLIARNICYAGNGRGIYLHNAETINVYGNLVFDCVTQMLVSSDTTGTNPERIVDLITQNNILIAKTASQTVLHLASNQNDIMNFINDYNDGVSGAITQLPKTRWDYNIYSRPLNENNEIIRRQIQGATTWYSVANWKPVYGWDQASTSGPLTFVSELDNFRLETNETQAPITINLNKTYLHPNGTSAGGSITLEPNKGVLLLKQSDINPNAQTNVTAIKKVFVNGFTKNKIADETSNIPSPDDLIGDYSVPSGFPISDFIAWDAVAGAAKFMLDFERPTETSSTRTGRVEVETNYPYIKTSEDIWFSASFKFAADYGSDPLKEALFQYHIGALGGSPPLSIRRENDRLKIEIYLDSGVTNQMWFDVGSATNDIWHNFVIRNKFRTNINDGRLTVWKEGQLARSHNPSTYNPWVIPTVNTTGISSYYIAYPELGAIQKTVIEGGVEVSLLDWKGITNREYPSPTKYPKIGIYKAPWTNRYNTDNTVKAGAYIEGDPLYVAPEFRKKTMWIKNWNFETRINSFSDVEIFKALDVNNNAPLETTEWFTGTVTPGQPPTIQLTAPQNQKAIIYPTSVNLMSTVTQADNTIAKVEYLVNSSIVGTVTSAPWSFNWINPTAGVKNIQAIVTDINNLTSTSNSVSITVYNFIDAQGVFRMFLNVGTNTPEDFNGQTFVGELYLYEGPSQVDNVQPDTTVKIFQTGRAYNILNYSIPVPNGFHTVKTYHNEPWFGVNDGGTAGPGKRVFDIFLQGLLVKDNFDIFVENANQNTIHTFENIEVTNGIMELYMVASVNNANLSALEIIPYTAPVVNQAPVAAATSNVSSGTVPLVVEFAGSSSTDDIGIVSYLWDFGDGNTSQEINPIHIYNQAGAYTAQLTVTDGEGLIGTDTIVVTVNEPVLIPPTVQITYPLPSTVLQVEQINVAIDAQDQDGTIAKVMLYLNNELVDEITVAPFESNISILPGTYALKAIAFDNDNMLTESETINFTVIPVPYINPYLVVRGRFVIHQS